MKEWSQPQSTHAVQMYGILVVGDVLKLNIQVYDVDNVVGNFIGKLARRSVQIYENTVQLLRHTDFYVM